MADFTLDTSGEVHGTGVETWYGKNGPWVCFWSDLDPFTQGYVEALWLSAYHDGQFATTMKARRRDMHLPGFSDLAPETLAAILKDCARLATLHAGTPGREEGIAAWGYRQSGTLLRFPTIAEVAQPLTPYLGDDGKVYLREGA